MWILRESDLKNTNNISFSHCKRNKNIAKSTLKTHFERNRRLEVVDVEKDC